MDRPSSPGKTWCSRSTFWVFSTEAPLEHELRYRVGEAGSFRESDFQPLGKIKGCTFRSGQGAAAATADLGTIKGLQKLREPAAFRLCLWGKDPRGIGKLEGTDLLITGRLAE